MVATDNNFGGFYRTEQYIQEARLKGAEVVLPCVNQSTYETTIEGKTVFLGFQHVADLGAKVIDALLLARKKQGEFIDFDNFTHRVSVSLDQAIILIRINAFRFTKKSKHWLLWKAHFLLVAYRPERGGRVGLLSLFENKENTKKVTIPELDVVPYEDVLDEIEYLGFPMCSPFELIDENERVKSNTVSADFEANLGKAVTLLGYLVHTKRTSTKGRVEQEMFFGTFMDLDGQFFDSVHFPLIAQKYKFKGLGIYLIQGKVSSDFGHLTLEAHYMVKVPYGKLVRV